jgi:hypothetical protein
MPFSAATWIRDARLLGDRITQFHCCVNYHLQMAMTGPAYPFSEQCNVEERRAWTMIALYERRRNLAAEQGHLLPITAAERDLRIAFNIPRRFTTPHDLRLGGTVDSVPIRLSHRLTRAGRSSVLRWTNWI